MKKLPLKNYYMTSITIQIYSKGSTGEETWLFGYDQICWQNKSWLLNHDKAPAHRCSLVIRKITEDQF